MSEINILLIDNYDSFSYNLVDQFRGLSCSVTLYRNSVSLNRIIYHLTRMTRPVLVFSPGPGRPSQAGCMPELIDRFKGIIPMIGICLGHQALIESYGGSLKKADQIIHGKASLISFQPHPVFSKMTSPLSVARYHSLCADNLPDTLIPIAHDQSMVMAVVNNQHKTIGYQFHPESILTRCGSQILHNTLNWIMSPAEPHSLGERP